MSTRDFAFRATVVTLALSVLWIRYGGDEAELEPLLREQAAKRNGSVESYHRLASSHLVLHQGSVEVLVRRRIRIGFYFWPYETELLARPPLSRNADLEVYPEGPFTELRRIFGGKDLELGDRFFDRAYWVRAKDERVARRLLTPTLRAQLLAIRDLDPEVRIFSGTVRLEVWRRFKTSAEYDRFIDAGLLLIDTASRLG